MNDPTTVNPASGVIVPLLAAVSEATSASHPEPPPGHASVPVGPAVKVVPLPLFVTDAASSGVGSGTLKPRTITDLDDAEVLSVQVIVSPATSAVPITLRKLRINETLVPTRA